jgi:hypothetical protein
MDSTVERLSREIFTWIQRQDSHGFNGGEAIAGEIHTDGTAERLPPERFIVFIGGGPVARGLRSSSLLRFCISDYRSDYISDAAAGGTCQREGGRAAGGLGLVLGLGLGLGLGVESGCAHVPWRLGS